jgi:type IV pilus assembly protein PilW
MYVRKAHHGFTLIEIMIAISISAVITSAFYQMFFSQQRSYLLQEQVAEMQQNLRTGLYVMVRDIRSAGFDPDLNGLTRFVTDFAPPNAIFGTDPIDYTVDRNIIAFTTDDDEDGTIDLTRAEMIAYRLNGNTLQRYNVQLDPDPTQRWETVAANIDALDFVFLAQDGTVTTNPDNATAVEITLLVRTGQKDTNYTSTSPYLNKQGNDICSACNTGENRLHRRRLLSTTVALRN